MEKDVDLILDAAADAGVELPVAKELKSLLRSAVDAGYGDHDFTALFLRLRSASSQEVAP
jgi:3-hydroxyisobutyrate dehydrogenase-like beta-hydroxyacid dehydrogenase